VDGRRQVLEEFATHANIVGDGIGIEEEFETQLVSRED